METMRATKTYTAVVTVTVEYNSDGGTSEPTSDKVARAAEEAVSVDLNTDDSGHQPDDDSEITAVSINWDTLKPTKDKRK